MFKVAGSGDRKGGVSLKGRNPRPWREKT